MILQGGLNAPHGVQVYLDGERIHKCLFADTEACAVYIMHESETNFAEGEAIILPEIRRFTGTVEIRFTEEWPIQGKGTDVYHAVPDSVQTSLAMRLLRVLPNTGKEFFAAMIDNDD